MNRPISAALLSTLAAALLSWSGAQAATSAQAGGQDVVVLGLLMSDGVLTSIPTRHYGQWESSGGMGGGMQTSQP